MRAHLKVFPITAQGLLLPFKSTYTHRRVTEIELQLTNARLLTITPKVDHFHSLRWEIRSRALSYL